MWTSYRQCQLHLANLICRLNNSLSGSLSYSKREMDKLRREIDNYIDETIASIPFMLAGDSIHYYQPDGPVWQLPRTPVLLGGLNLQWVLFTIATLESTPEPSKVNAKNTLLWFGETLGIGQAKVLAHVPAACTRLIKRQANAHRCLIILALPLAVMHFGGVDSFFNFFAIPRTKRPCK